MHTEMPVTVEVTIEAKDEEEALEIFRKLNIRLLITESETNFDKGE